MTDERELVRKEVMALLAAHLADPNGMCLLLALERMYSVGLATWRDDPLFWSVLVQLVEPLVDVFRLTPDAITKDRLADALHLSGSGGSIGRQAWAAIDRVLAADLVGKGRGAGLSPTQARKQAAKALKLDESTVRDADLRMNSNDPRRPRRKKTT